MGVIYSASTVAADKNERVRFLVDSLVGSKADLTQKSDEYGYALGLYMSHHVEKQLENLSETSVKLDEKMIIKGFVDGLEHQGTLSSEQAELLMLELSQKIEQARAATKSIQREKNKAQSDALIERLNERGEFITTASGLKYRVIREGNGPRPTMSDTVVVHYKGNLVDGTVFDSSYDRNEPSRFTPGQVIPGWQETLLMMKNGAHWQVVVPPELGYGQNGTARIPANSVLIFEIELLDIE